MARTAVKVRPVVKPIAVVKPMARGTAVAEMATAMGCSQDVIDVANFGVQKNLLKAVIVSAIDAQGFERDRVTLTFSPDDSGEILVEDDDNRAMIERIDGSLGHAVGVFAKRMADKGWSPDASFLFHDHINADPAALAAARVELGVAPRAEPKQLPGTLQRNLISITPGKDKGLNLTISRSVQPKRKA